MMVDRSKDPKDRVAVDVDCQKRLLKSPSPGNGLIAVDIYYKVDSVAHAVCG